MKGASALSKSSPEIKNVANFHAALPQQRCRYYREVSVSQEGVAPREMETDFYKTTVDLGRPAGRKSRKTKSAKQIGYNRTAKLLPHNSRPTKSNLDAPTVPRGQRLMWKAVHKNTVSE